MAIIEQFIIDILKQEMSLADNDIWIANQNRNIEIDQGVYISVAMVDSKILSSTNSIIPTVAGMDEVQQIAARENVQIDMFSRSTDGLTRRFEILAALRSFYAVQQQEEKDFKIFSIPTTFINSSGAEGGSNINRFTIIIACHTLFTKQKVLSSANGDYYDEFKTRVDDEKSIGTPTGIIEFTTTP